jgi:hypothetical protein
MRTNTMIEVLIHKSTGTALAWPLDFTDREYLALRVTDENNLRFGAFEPDPVDELDGGPCYQPMSAGRVGMGRRVKRTHAAKRRTFRDLN